MAHPTGNNPLQPRDAGGRFGEVERAEATEVVLLPEPTADDLDFARDTLGPDATEDEIRHLAEQRLDRDTDKAPQALMARVQPQAWINDYAVDSGPSVTFDVAPVLRAMPEDDRARFLAALHEDGDDGYVLDDLYVAAAEQGLVESGYGPFYVTSDASDDDIDAWDAANPYEDPRRTPADAATMTLFNDLKPGDVFLVEQYSEGDPVYVEVTVLGDPVATEDIFGRSMQSLPCRRSDTGAEGGYMYGPEGFTRKARICERHGGAWGNDRTCPGCTEPDGATRPTPEETR